jgi:hypothetical protein
MLTKIKNWFYHRNLQKKLKDKDAVHRAVSLGEAKTICIFFDASEEKNIETVKTFTKKLQQQDKRVELLGYLAKEEKNVSITINYFTSKNTNWYSVPNDNLIDEYAGNSYDLLLNFYPKTNLVFEYLSALSKATCRVGRYISDKHYYCDLMFSIKETDTLDTLIEQTEYYLNQIKVSKNVTTI